MELLRQSKRNVITSGAFWQEPGDEAASHGATRHGGWHGNQDGYAAETYGTQEAKAPIEKEKIHGPAEKIIRTFFLDDGYPKPRDKQKKSAIN